MNNTKRIIGKVMIAAATVLSLATFSSGAMAAGEEALQQTSSIALQNLYKTNPTAEVIGKSAKAILIFPSIVKAGFIFGGAYGEGVLNKGSTFSGYFNSVTASWGWQAGAESYGYVVFLMNDKAIKYLEKSQGWEIGVGPSVVVVNEGVAKNLSSTTLKDDAYAFIFDQKGLMVSLSIEGTKISRIKK